MYYGCTPPPLIFNIYHGDTCAHTDTDTDRQTDRNRQTDTDRHRQTDRQTEGQTQIHTQRTMPKIMKIANTRVTTKAIPADSP